MRPTRIAAALLALGVFSVWGNGYAADEVDFGQREYQSHCSLCHGWEGKGDGPYASYVQFKTKIPDLTTLSKKNNGVFPFQRVYEIIDGTEVLKAHGTREMPIWGPEYRTQIEGMYAGAPVNREAYARAHILALVHYLNRLQAK
jgi:mono/diheme cytochrome c family protein